MAKNRELSQLGALVVVDDSNRNIGIATTATPSVGIGTTNPAYKLDVEGDINSRTEVRVKGVGVSTGALRSSAVEVIDYEVWNVIVHALFSGVFRFDALLRVCE